MILCFFFAPQFLNARPVSQDDVRKAGLSKAGYEEQKSAKLFASGKARASYSRGHSIRQVREITDAATNKVLAYEMDLSPKGYVVLSPDTDITPVIAYSFDSDFVIEDSSYNVLLHLVTWDMNSRLSALPATPREVKDANGLLWDKYLNNSLSTDQSFTAYGPLIHTASWNQDTPYNNTCPVDTKTGYRSDTGCVATSMAQIVNYWGYPSAVTFSAGDNYTSIMDPGDGKGTRLISITATTANFSGITYPVTSDSGKAALSYACGVASKMGYSSSGSGAYHTDSAAAFKNKFGYASADYITYSASPSAFYTTLQSNMANGEPAQLGIWNGKNDSTSARHSIVCDGYDSANGQYHVNLGWGGASDGWYTLPNIGTGYGFNTLTEAVVNITRTLAPPAVSGLNPASGSAGGLVIVNGSNFGTSQGAGYVKFSNNLTATIVSWSDTRIQCIVPSGAVTGNITVTTGGGTSSGVPFTAGYPQSPHNYPDSTDFTCVYTLGGSPGAINVAFDALTQIAGSYDYLYIMDGSGTNIAGSPFTGATLAGQTKQVPGATVKIRLTSNSSLNYWGFNVTGVTAADITPPPAPLGLSAAPGGWTNANSFTVNWTNPADASGIAGAYYKKGDTPPVSSSDYDAYVAGAPPLGGITAAEGAHKIYVWLTDGSGNSSYSNYSSTWTYYDGTKPVSSYSQAPASPDGSNGWYRSDVQVSLSASDSGGSGVAAGYPHYKTDSGTELPYSSPFTVTGEGTHTVEYWSQDNAANAEVHQINSFKIDKTAPASSVSVLNRYTNAASFSVQWSGSDTGGSGLAAAPYEVQYKAGTGAWTDWPGYTGTSAVSAVFGPASPVAVQDGQTYSFRSRATDKAGNTEAYLAAPDTFTLVDLSGPPAPAVTSTTNAEGVYNVTDNSPKFDWPAPSDVSGIAGYSLVLDHAQSSVPPPAVGFTGTTTQYMNVADGAWYFHLRAEDNAGNWGGTATYGPVKIDITAPTFTGIAASRDPAKEGAVTLTVTASEQMSEMAASVTQHLGAPAAVPLTSQDGIAWTGSYNVGGGFDGTAAIAVTGKDLAGRSGSGAGSFGVDTTAPQKPAAASSTHPANTPVSKNTAAFSWSPSSDPGGSGVAGYSYAINQEEAFDLDLATDTVSTNSVSSPLSDGTWWFHLRAVDNAGNGSPIERYKFIVDSASPTFTASYSGNPCKAGPLGLTVTANEPLKQAPAVSVLQNGQGSPASLAMTSSDNIVWTGSYTVLPGYDGPAAVSMTGADLAGNTGTGSGAFQVDTLGPSAAIALSPPGPLKTGPFTVSLTIADASAVTGTPVLSYTPAGQQPVLVNLTGSNGTWTGRSFIESVMSTGTAAFGFSAVDAAGNAGTSVTSGDTFVIDAAVDGNTGGVVGNSDNTTAAVGPGAYNGGLVINIGTPDKTLSDIVEANGNTPALTPVEGQDLYRKYTAHDSSTSLAVTAFNAPVTITISYPDANNDGIVDGSGIGESRLRLYWLNEAARKWEEVPGAKPDYAAKKISAPVSHFSIYSLLAALPSAGVYPIPWKPGSGGKFDSAHVSGCGSGIIFDKLETGAKIGIYNYSGDLVRELAVAAADFGCKAWDGKNGSGRDVASGVYLALIKTSAGRTVKKLAIER